MTMNKDIYKIEWKFSDAGTLQYVRPLLEEKYQRKNLKPREIISESLLKRVQNNDKLAVYYKSIEDNFNIDFNSLKLDELFFDDFSVDLALMLATQLEGIENQRFPKLGDSCWANVLLKEDFEGCGQEKETELRQPLTGRTNIQLPISTIYILSSNHELEYKFEEKFGSQENSEEYLVSYSVSSKNCSDVSGWGERPIESDNFMRVSSTASSSILLNWCGSSIEDTNLCLTLYSLSDNAEISVRKQDPIKKMIKTDDYYDNYHDDIEDENLPSCPEKVESGSCWIDGANAKCEGVVNGCDNHQITCGKILKIGPKITIAAVSGGAALILVFVIAVVVILVIKKRKSSKRHPAESALPYTAPRNNNRTGYSFR